MQSVSLRARTHPRRKRPVCSAVLQTAEKLGFEIGRDFSPGNNGLQINVGFSPWDMLFPAFSPSTDFSAAPGSSRHCPIRL
jgi:hypothetical protein